MNDHCQRNDLQTNLKSKKCAQRDAAQDGSETFWLNYDWKSFCSTNAKSTKI